VTASNPSTSSARVRLEVERIVRGVLTEKNKPQPELRDESTLQGDLGLDSLDLAVVVVRLESRLGYDPFRSGQPLARTFGQFVQLYEQQCNGQDRG